jgi:hypothetical protein
MAKHLTWTAACLAGVLAPWLCATAPAAADEQFATTAVVQLPDAQILSAFDISFVDPKTHTLAIASSRIIGSAGPIARVIIVDTRQNVVTKELQASPPFVGDCSVPPARDTFSGPNGVMVIEHGDNADVWVGDGPVFNTHCVPGSGLKTPSTVRVLDLRTGATKATIPTGNGQPGTLGARRADELCFNPRSDTVLVANDDPVDNFIAFIGEDSFKVLQRIRFDGTDPNAGTDPATGKPILANGIEQCVFDPRDGKFWLNIPATGPTGASPGLIVKISGEAPFHVEQVVTFAAATGCGGAAGLAVGPDHQLGLACGGANALIIDDRTGQPVPGGVLTGEGGADEMWFNPGDNHYFFARTGARTLGTVDAGPPPTLDAGAATGNGSHSVAADPHRNQVYVPIRGNNGTTPVSAGAAASNICSKAKDVNGHTGSDALGCIAIYTAPGDTDDRHAESENSQGR